MKRSFSTISTTQKKGYISMPSSLRRCLTEALGIDSAIETITTTGLADQIRLGGSEEQHSPLLAALVPTAGPYYHNTAALSAPLSRLPMG